MAQSFISEIGDQLGGDGVANTEGEHVKIISAEYYKRIDNGVVTNVRIQDAISSTGNGKVVATDQSNVNSEFKLLATASASPTSGALTEAVYDTGITMNPSTNTLTANLAGTATYAKALDPQIILNTTLYKVPVISADKEVRWSGAPGASGSTTELTYDNTDSKNLLSVNVSGYATSIYHAFASSSSSTVAETPIINVSGSTDGFLLTYGATTADLGITKFYTTDDANAKLSFGNMVSSTYKEALVITNGSATLNGTATSANYPAGFSSRDSSLPNWGTLTSGNGYTSITRWVSVDSEIVFAKKSGALSVQIDGLFYQNEGQYQVLDTSSRGAANGVASLDANGKVPTAQLPTVPTADKLAMPSSGSNAITGVESSGGYLTQAYSNTGYPETYGNVLTVGGKGGSQLFMGWAGSTQGISKVYYRNRRDVATTSGECWSDWKAFAWSDHKHSGSDITSGTVGVSYGGTGKSSVSANNFLVGNGTSALVEKTPTEVRSLIGAGTSSLTIGTSSTTAAAGNHSHGNITTDGKLQSSDVSIASGDKIVVTDSSNGNKVARTSLSFDGSTTSQALTKKGTFETFAKITWLDGIPLNPVPGMIYAI